MTTLLFSAYGDATSEQSKLFTAKVEGPYKVTGASSKVSGAEEALMCNYRGELTECSQSNFFIVRGGAALTPRSEAGLLEGVTRAFVFELGGGLGIDVREETLMPIDLETADEMFITSTTRELSPVVKVDDRVVGSGRPGPVTKKLLDLYQRRAQELTRPMTTKR